MHFICEIWEDMINRNILLKGPTHYIPVHTTQIWAELCAGGSNGLDEDWHLILTRLVGSGCTLRLDGVADAMKASVCSLGILLDQTLQTDTGGRCVHKCLQPALPHLLMPWLQPSLITAIHSIWGGPWKPQGNYRWYRMLRSIYWLVCEQM